MTYSEDLLLGISEEPKCLKGALKMILLKKERLGRCKFRTIERVYVGTHTQNVEGSNRMKMLPFRMMLRLSVRTEKNSCHANMKKKLSLAC